MNGKTGPYCRRTTDELRPIQKTFSATLHAAMYRNGVRHDMFDGIGLDTQGHWTE